MGGRATLGHTQVSVCTGHDTMRLDGHLVCTSHQSTGMHNATGTHGAREDGRAPGMHMHMHMHAREDGRAPGMRTWLAGMPIAPVWLEQHMLEGSVVVGEHGAGTGLGVERQFVDEVSRGNPEGRLHLRVPADEASVRVCMGVGKVGMGGMGGMGVGGMGTGMGVAFGMSVHAWARGRACTACTHA